MELVTHEARYPEPPSQPSLIPELFEPRCTDICARIAAALQNATTSKPTQQPKSPSLRPGLSTKSLNDATARYSTTADLRKLLTHDEERGGIPIRLLSARWLLTYFQAKGNETARLEHRQWLEREHPEAFVSGEALERVLAELEERTVKYKDHYGRDAENCSGSFT